MRMVPLSSIVANYRDHKLQEELATDWGSVVFYRGPAFVLAWLLVPLGVTPNQLTVTGMLLIPAIVVACWVLPPGHAMAVMTVLALAYNVLDCADGPLARATNRSSLAGRYMDFAADILYRNTAYACYGLVADRIWPGATIPWLAVGLCCAVFVTYTRVNRIYAEKLFSASAAEAPARRSIFDVAFSLLSGLDTLLPLLALFAWEMGLLRELMVWFLLYTLGDAAIEVVANGLKASKLDRQKGRLSGPEP